ncbi:hypothetical protein DESAMIL20_53 [Desulfurella amilsii]|uniref:Uncharacterized protein n=1 Tax=Desulfurella amilsii TaxID=1562698 RepID=A0A1X4XZI1_9BACT|nr:hypothetical protein [Desulfurella amilsii]OSS42945.1 hypothetical protein DESAMIL20_53 [Desulfurella amilsii]
MNQIKKLEIILVILYLIASLVAFFVINFLFVGVLVGGALAVIDWFILKRMSFGWVKKGKFSFFGNIARLIAIAVLIILSYKLLLYSFVGLVIGFSIMPVAVFVYFVLYGKKLDREG